jgi:Tfp pilus assembly protein PilF
VPGASADKSPWMGGVYLLRYVVRIVLPLPKAARTPVEAPGLLLIGLSLFVWATTIVSLLHRSMTPRARLLLVWFLLGMLPVAELLPLGVSYYDPLVYLPLVPVTLGLGLLCERWVERRWLIWSCAALLAVCGALSVHSALVWKNNRALWSQAIRFHPDDAIININFANALRQQGDTEAGCRHLARTLKLNPPQRFLPYLHYNLGNCARAEGKHRQAAERYRQALILSTGEMVQARHNLALSLLALNEPRAALSEAEALVRQTPQLAGSWKLLGVVQARLGSYTAAAMAFQRALSLQPTDAHTRRMLATVQREPGAPRYEHRSRSGE